MERTNISPIAGLISRPLDTERWSTRGQRRLRKTYNHCRLNNSGLSYYNSSNFTSPCNTFCYYTACFYATQSLARHHCLRPRRNKRREHCNRKIQINQKLITITILVSISRGEQLQPRINQPAMLAETVWLATCRTDRFSGAVGVVSLHAWSRLAK